MDQVGPFANPVVAGLVIFVVPALMGLALYRGEQAYRNRVEEVIRARARRAYVCFLAWGIFVSLAAAVAIVSEPYLEVVGIFGAIPVGIVAAIGLFHTLMVWRVRLIQILLLATFLLGALAAMASLPDMWVAVIAAGYGLGVIMITVQGLRGLHRGAAS